MENSLELHDMMAQSISYPGSEFRDHVVQLNELVNSLEPSFKSKEVFQKFAQYVEDHNLDEMEELYTSTFDIHAPCCLDVGFTLLGEDVKRGEMLVHLNRMQREAGVDCGFEMSDHLPNMLNLIPRLKEGEEKRHLLEKVVLPAVGKMVETFSESGNSNIFRYPLEIIQELLETDLKSTSRGVE